MSAFTDDAVKQCKIEFKRFDEGKGRETKHPFSGFVGEYWKEGLKIKSIDGNTTFQDNKGNKFRPAWSSAFISFIMRKSGAGTKFLYSEAHVHYVVQAIRDAKDPNTKAKFLGRNPKLYAPKIGDIINEGRQDDKDVTFSSVLAKYGSKDAPDGRFIATHSDIVIAFDAANNSLTTIGGNVATDTVGDKTWQLKSDGTLKKGATLICVIECLL
jgi:hypothetical protein